MARPPKPASERRTRRLVIHVTAEEMKRYRILAAINEVPLPVYIREILDAEYSLEARDNETLPQVE